MQKSNSDTRVLHVVVWDVFIVSPTLEVWQIWSKYVLAHSCSSANVPARIFDLLFYNNPAIVCKRTSCGQGFAKKA
jgi:hypothetical protein